MARFPLEKLLDFLGIVDEEIGEPSELLIIGGAAIAIAYSSVKYATADIDVLEVSSTRFNDAIQRARERSPDPVPISITTVATTPLNYEERRVPVEPTRFKWIRLYVPEQHDLAMMKLARGNVTDIDALVDVHEHYPFVLDTLLERYIETLPCLIGVDPKMFEWAFLAFVAELFKDAGVAAARAKIQKHKARG